VEVGDGRVGCTCIFRKTAVYTVRARDSALYVHLQEDGCI
jgi:hypothetical protein